MLTVTSETTVAELGSFLAERKATFSAIANGKSWFFGLTLDGKTESGPGPDLVTALNDALGKVRG